MIACPKQVKIRDKRHLINVRSFLCFSCGINQEIQAHHLLKLPEGLHKEESGTAQKNGDNWAIPLCRRCHGSLHMAGSEEKFFGKDRALDAIDCAKYLWGKTRLLNEKTTQEKL